MAKVELQKVRITGLKNHYDILMKELQRRGLLHIKSNPEFAKMSICGSDKSLVDDFELARVDFAINLLSPYVKKKGKLESILTGGKLIMKEKDAKERFDDFEQKIPVIIEECEKIEEERVKAINEIKISKKKISELENFANFSSKIGESFDTENVKTVIGSISSGDKKDLISYMSMKSNLIDMDIFHSSKRDVFFRLTYFLSEEREIQDSLNFFKFKEVDLVSNFNELVGLTPAESLKKINESIVNHENLIKEFELRKEELACNMDDLKISYDFYKWKKDKDEEIKNVLMSEYIFSFEAWVPNEKFISMDHWIKQVFVGDVSMEKIQKTEEEKEPCLLKNKPGVSSFQLITEMYGLPVEKDVDPTLGMAPFFVIFFGICLSDTGYGIILFLVASFFLLFGKFSKEARTSLWMLFLLGSSAILGGFLLGGHLGMTPEQAPSFLTTTNSIGEIVFRGQVLDPMKGNGAMTFLIVTFAIGIFQLLFGLVMEFIRNWKNKEYIAAFADSAAWFFFISSLIGWALAEKIGLPKDVFYIMMMSGMGVLILTQGREKTHNNIFISIILKLVFGLLGLYGIMDYVSNMLSYSRLMALGLSTGVIGSAMNMTAGVLGDMVPGFAGVIVMIAFLLFGHSINLGLSTMGAFIHSMRLQFIEFFGVFYSGGAEMFKPFSQVKKYLLFRS